MTQPHRHVDIIQGNDLSWSVVEDAVTLEQASGVVTWGAAVMLLAAEVYRRAWRFHRPTTHPSSCFATARSWLFACFASRLAM